MGPLVLVIKGLVLMGSPSNIEVIGAPSVSIDYYNLI